MRPQHVGLYPITVFLGCLLSLPVFSQDKEKIRFGKIDPKDFSKTGFEQDTGAHAVILADIGNSAFEADRTSGLVLLFKRHRRIKIVDKNGYDEATVEIPLYKNGNAEEKVTDLKATTYNLEDGKVVATKMDSKSVFTDKLDKKNYTNRKFTMPAVKEGSIIEYTYTVSSPFYFNLQPWSFQDEYPTLYTEYEVTIPEFYDFIFLSQGYQKIEAKPKEEGHQVFNFTVEQDNGYGGTTGRTDMVSYTANTYTYHWSGRNIPAIREEAFTTALMNHVARIEFQLSSKKYPNQPMVPVLGTWNKLYEEMNKDEDFGANLDKNGFTDDVVDKLVAGASSDTARARRIYEYVRKNYTCTRHSGLYLTKSLRSTFNEKSGSEADINLLLVSMLRRAKLDASPLILSTRSHGITYEMYPLINRFNYTIAALNTQDGWFFLDASEPYLGFGRLAASCYNGHARIMNAQVPAVEFDPNNLLEQKSTFVMIMPDSGKLKGSFQQRPTYFESCAMRTEIEKKGKDAFFKPMVKNYSMETAISNTAVDDLDEHELPVSLKYNFEMTPDDASIIYINPMLGEGYKSNPFKSLERHYPVEMTATTDELYTLSLVIPDGFEVEELPKPAMVKYNEDEGLFQYLIQQSDNTIQFRCRVKLNKAVFAPDEYSSLREFFDMIVKKESEQIVLKKKA